MSERFPSWHKYEETIQAKLKEKESRAYQVGWTNKHLKGGSFKKIPLEEQKELLKEIFNQLRIHHSLRMDIRKIDVNADPLLKKTEIVIDPLEIKKQEMLTRRKIGGIHQDRNIILPNIIESVRSGSLLHELLHDKQLLDGEMIHTKDATGAFYMFGFEAEAKAIEYVCHPDHMPATQHIKDFAEREALEYFKAYQRGEPAGRLWQEFLDNNKDVLPSLDTKGTELHRNSHRIQAFTEYRQRGYTMQLFLVHPDNRAKYMRKLAIDLTLKDIDTINWWHYNYQDQAFWTGRVKKTSTYSKKAINKLKEKYRQRYGMDIPVEEAMHSYLTAQKRHKNSRLLSRATASMIKAEISSKQHEKATLELNHETPQKTVKSTLANAAEAGKTSVGRQAMQISGKAAKGVIKGAT